MFYRQQKALFSRVVIRTTVRGIFISMVLSYKELRKRDVVNIADGRSFGKITDLKLDFPCATLKGITVCDRNRRGLCGLWCKNEIFIDEKQIVRIGGDVILVNIKNFDTTTPSVVELNSKSNLSAQNLSNKKPEKLCPPCPKPVPPAPPINPCPPPMPPLPHCVPENGKDFFGEDVNFDDC